MLTVVLIGLLVFALHCSTVFFILQPGLHYALCSTTATIGFISHYLFPQLRKATPWLLISKPVLRTAEFNMYETVEGARLVWFEKVFAVFNFLERNVLYPLVIMSAITIGTPTLMERTGPWLTSLILVITGLKLMRSVINIMNIRGFRLICLFLSGLLIATLLSCICRCQQLYYYSCSICPASLKHFWWTFSLWLCCGLSSRNLCLS